MKARESSIRTGEYEGRCVQYTRDAAGDVVIKHCRHRNAPRLPGMGATVPHPTRPDWVIDLRWIVRAGVTVLVFVAGLACLWMMAAPWLAI